jgi:LysM repeat protein
MTKWLFVIGLAILIFGGAYWFSRDVLFKQEIEVRKEQRGEVTPVPTPDIGLGEFQAAAKLRQEGKMAEARSALTLFIQKYPTSPHADAAKEMLGEVNIEILLSTYPSPEKEEYVVKPGDVLAKIAHKTKSTAELIMRMNNLSSTMLRIGQRLLISHPNFSILIQPQARVVVLLDNGAFFKQYRVREEKLPAKQPSKISTRVTDIMAWNDGKRVGFGSKDYAGSTRWIRLGSAAYIIYSLPDATHPNVQEPPPQGLGLDASDVEELSGLINTKTPVTIADVES